MSCADVCLDMDYDNDNEFFSRREVTARKEHRCCECKRTIQSGERYEYVSGKSDGAIWQAKTCAECAEIRQTFVCGSWLYGELFEEIRNAMFPVWEESGPLDCLAKVESLAARNKLRAMYVEWRKP